MVMRASGLKIGEVSCGFYARRGEAITVPRPSWICWMEITERTKIPKNPTKTNPFTNGFKSQGTYRLRMNLATRPNPLD